MNSQDRTFQCIARQIVTNLLVNAVTYTQEGTIEVEAGRSNGTVGLAVRDTGVGLTPDEIKQVFELFYQAPQPLDRPRGGLGVGLSLAQRLVLLHDGTIAARSAGRGKGSEFTVKPAVRHRIARGRARRRAAGRGCVS